MAGFFRTFVYVLVVSVFHLRSVVASATTSNSAVATHKFRQSKSRARSKKARAKDDDDDDDESASSLSDDPLLAKDTADEASLHDAQQATLRQALLSSSTAKSSGKKSSKGEDKDDDDDKDDESDDESDDDSDDDSDDETKVASKWTIHENTPRLEAIRLRNVELDILIADIKNQEAFHKKVDNDVLQVTRETETNNLGPFLGSMWKEMRMFASPFYLQHLEEEKAALAAEEKKLRGEAHPCIHDEKTPKVIEEAPNVHAHAGGASVAPSLLLIIAAVSSVFALH